MNRKEMIVVAIVLLITFIGGATGAPSTILSVFVTNFPSNQNVTVTNFPKNQNTTVTNFPGTHIGQSVNSIVTLSCHQSGLSQPFDLSCTRSPANGTAFCLCTPPDFTIPTGLDLVVTDVSWSGFATNGAGNTVYLSMLVVNASTLSGGQVLFSSTTLASDGGFAVSEHMTTGFVVSWTAKMILFTNANTNVNPSIVIHGYLTTT